MHGSADTTLATGHATPTFGQETGIVIDRRSHPVVVEPKIV